jgi:hypothetical protein
MYLRSWIDPVWLQVCERLAPKNEGYALERLQESGRQYRTSDVEALARMLL